MKHRLLYDSIRMMPVLSVVILAVALVYLHGKGEPEPAATRPSRHSTPPATVTVDQRREAIDSLAKLGPDAPASAIRQLVAALGDRDPVVHRTAARGLARIGERAIPELTAALGEKNRALRHAAARVLSEIDPTNPASVPVLIGGLKDKVLRIESLAALAAIGEPALPGLIDALKDRNPAIRRDAASVLRDLGPRARAAVPALGEVLKVPERDVRLAAAQALGQIGGDSAVPLLVDCFQDPFPEVRLQAVDSVVVIGPPAVPPLTRALAHDNKLVRGLSARSLGLIGPPAKPAMEPLTRTIEDPDVHVRREAAKTLVVLGVRTDAVIAVLSESLPADKDTRWEALRCLMQCGDPGIRALIAALKHPETIVRDETARALGQAGADAKDAVPALIELLKDPDRSVRREAAHSLGRIGGDPALSVPALVQALKDPYPINRGEAAIALARLGPLAKGAVPALIEAMKDESLDASQEAGKALVEIGPSALPALRQALTHPDEVIRRRAAEVLKQLGE